MTIYEPDYYKNKLNKTNNKTRKFKLFIILIILVSLISVIVALSITNVPVGHTGILLTFGRVQEGALSEGLHFIIPFVQEVVAMDNRVQKLEVYTQAFSIDIQTVSARLAVNYQINREDTFEIYRSIGLNFERIIIEPAVHEVLKNISAQYTAEELISLRTSVSDEIMATLNKEMQRSGITVTALNIIDFSFTDDFIRAVEEKQIAEQRQQQADIDNITMILRSAAEAQSMEIIAHAEAEVLRIMAESIAESYRLQNEYLTELNVVLEWISQWDGILPIVQSGDGGGMILDISGLTRD